VVEFVVLIEALVVKNAVGEIKNGFIRKREQRGLEHQLWDGGERRIDSHAADTPQLK
jgi:hypothetical protein